MPVERHSARLAFAARGERAIGALTEQQATEPECQLLFSDASRALQKQARRQRAPLDRTTEVLARSRMTVQWKKRHDRKIGRLFVPLNLLSQRRQRTVMLRQTASAS
jgi:hypothetical protein